MIKKGKQNSCLVPMEIHGKSSSEHPFWCGHVFVLGWWAEIRQLILSMVCLGFTDRWLNAFGLGGSLLFSGQGKWNRNVIWDNLLVCTFLLPSWLVRPFPGISWHSSTQGSLQPLPKPPVTPWKHLPISLTLTSWVRRGWRNWAMKVKISGFAPLVSCPETPPGVLVYLPKCSSSSVHMVPVRKDFPVFLLPGSLGVAEVPDHGSPWEGLALCKGTV